MKISKRQLTKLIVAIPSKHTLQYVTRNLRFGLSQIRHIAPENHEMTGCRVSPAPPQPKTMRQTKYLDPKASHEKKIFFLRKCFFAIFFTFWICLVTYLDHSSPLRVKMCWKFSPDSCVSDNVDEV